MMHLYFKYKLFTIILQNNKVRKEINNIIMKNADLDAFIKMILVLDSN